MQNIHLVEQVISLAYSQDSSVKSWVEEREKRKENELFFFDTKRTSLASHETMRQSRCSAEPVDYRDGMWSPSSFLNPVCIASFLPPAAIFPVRALSRGDFPFALNPLHQAPNPILLKPNRLLPKSI
jgi:hypothetical protein